MVKGGHDGRYSCLAVERGYRGRLVDREDTPERLFLYGGEPTNEAPDLVGDLPTPGGPGEPRPPGLGPVAEP